MDAFFASTLGDGLKKGLTASLRIIAIMCPVTAAVTLLKITPVLGWLSEWCRPLMGLVGLRGEAALPFILGSTLNLYVAVGAMIPLGLTGKETTILAAILLISHNLIVETAVLKGMGVPWLKLLLLRLGAALFLGLILSWTL